MESIRNRPWVEKFESGEYLRQWNEFEPILICGSYSQNMDIGESKFYNCVGGFSGIGDVDWWITAELEKLSSDEINELLLICKYKTYLDKILRNYDLIQKISNFYGCETFHIFRTGNKKMLEFISILNNFHKSIVEGSMNCLDEKTIKFKEQENIFKILTFEEFKN